MRKFYNETVFEITYFNQDDIMVLSGIEVGVDEDGNGDFVMAPEGW